jgi:hypothetical protein
LALTACPFIQGGIQSGATTVSGTSTEANGTLITVFKNGLSIGTTTVNSGSWSLTGISPALAGNDIITATALAVGKAVSNSECNPRTVGALCAPPLNISLTAECTPKKGFFGSAGSAVAGAVINIYNYLNVLQNPNAGSIFSAGTITANADGSWVWKCNGNASCSAGANNCIADGTYLLTQTVAGCESDPILICVGGSGVATTPVITNTPSAGSTSVSGTGPANSAILIYFNNGTPNYITQGTSNASGTWTVSGLSPLEPCTNILLV